MVILLMPEILHHAVEVGSLSHYLQGFVHPRWLFGISEPSKIVDEKEIFTLDLKRRKGQCLFSQSPQKLGYITYTSRGQTLEIYGFHLIYPVYLTPFKRGVCRHRFVSSVVTCPINRYRILHGKDSKNHNSCSLNSCCFWRRVKGWYSKTNLSTSIKFRRSTGMGMTIQEQSHLLLPHLLIETFKPRTTKRSVFVPMSPRRFSDLDEVSRVPSNDDEERRVNVYKPATWMKENVTFLRIFLLIGGKREFQT